MITYRYNSNVAAEKTGYTDGYIRRKCAEITPIISTFAYKDSQGKWWLDDKAIAALLIIRSQVKMEGHSDSQSYALSVIYGYNPDERFKLSE